MPALKVWGYRTKLAGDDLSPLCLLTTALRILELCLLIPAATMYVDDYYDGPKDECYGHKSGKARVGAIPVPYFVCSIVFAAASFAMAAAMYHISGRGSPTQPELRKGIGKLFAVQLFFVPSLLLVLVVVGITGLSYIRARITCVGFIETKPAWYIQFSAAVAFQFIEVCIYFIIILWWLQSELRQRIVPRKEEAPKDLQTKAEEWENCCQCCCKYTALCCCFSFGGRGIDTEDFGGMSRTLAELFDDGGTLDLVASDIVCGMMALAMIQEERKRDCVEKLQKEAAALDLGSELEELDPNTTSRAVIFSRSRLKGILGLLKASADVEDGSQDATASAVDEVGEDQPHSEMGLIYQPYAVGANGVMRYKFSVRTLLSAQNDADRLALAEGAWFLNYSIAINTWKNYIFMNLKTGCCQLAFARCSRMVASDKGPEREGVPKVIVGENLLGLHETALLKVVGFDKSKVELCYAHFNNEVDQAVYCIMIDHVWKTVILCIRGSLSLEDYVINLAIDPEDLEDLGNEYGFDGRGEYCHSGYLARAKWVCNDLKKHGILEALMSDDCSKCKDYTVRVVGHSLGAGTAAPVALMLRSKYPNLRCTCFAPPGGLFSLGIARKCEEFVTTYVLNTDLVPRISARTIELLRNELIEVIARIKIPKRQIMQIHRSQKKIRELSRGLDDMLHPRDAIPDSEFLRQFRRFQEWQKKREDERTEEKIPLYPPGRALHLVRTKSKDEGRELLQGRFMVSDLFNCVTCDRCVPEEEYAPRWGDIQDFNEITVSSTLISDHMVDNVGPALIRVAEAYGIDPSRPPPTSAAASQSSA